MQIKSPVTYVLLLFQSFFFPHFCDFPSARGWGRDRPVVDNGNPIKLQTCFDHDILILFPGTVLALFASLRNCQNRNYEQNHNCVGVFSTKRDRNWDGKCQKKRIRGKQSSIGNPPSSRWRCDDDDDDAEHNKMFPPQHLSKHAA